MVRRLGALGGTALAGAMAAMLAAPQPALAFKLFGYSFFESDEKPASPDAQPYTVDVKVTTQDDDLADRLRAASLLYANKDDTPPPSTPAFLSRARAEYERILAALYANGRYGGTIGISVAGRPLEQVAADATLPHPVPVTISIDPGPAFTFGSVVIKGRAPASDADDNPKIMTPEKLGLAPGKPARSETVLQSEQALVDEWRRLGYPKAQPLPRNVDADHKTDRLNVAIGVDSGRAAVYGPIAVTGTTDMDPDFVARQTGLVPGQRYDPADIDRAMRRLRHLQVFSSTRIVEDGAIAPNGALGMTVNVAERPQHVFGVGASYSSLDGAGAQAYWEHRNLFGEAERLRFDAQVSGIDNADPRKFTYLGGVTFIKPGVFTPFTDLTANLTASREVYDPYAQNTFGGRIGLSHEFSDQLTGKIAISGEYDRVEDAYNRYNPATQSFGTRDLTFISLPGELSYDGTDDKLEPTRGFRAKLSLEPFYEASYGNGGLIGRIDASTYYALDHDGRFVIAARAAVGSIVGAPADELPANRLFFAGGGGSVRGYAYRSLGPTITTVDGKDWVVGGRSLVEGSLEFRARITDSIGIVPFIDAGGAFASSYPDFSQDIKIGAGLGLRYYTGLGAIRVDVATPVNRDKGDSLVALYIGLGEAF